MTDFERNSDRRPRPRAFRLNGDETVTAKLIAPDEDVFAREAADIVAALPNGEQAVEAAQAKGLLQRFTFSWGGLFFSAISGIVSLAVTVWTWNFVEDLFARSAVLGTIGLALAVIAALAATVYLIREVIAMMRQNRIARLHIALAAAHAADDSKAARAGVGELCVLYDKRRETEGARAQLRENMKQIIDGRDLINLAERTLVAPLDDRARREIAAAAKRVSVFTAISPRAIFDVFFVAGQAIVLIRKIAEIYGGRPGLLGFFKLARSVGAHLAITGAVAVGDTLLQQIVGHGLAARLSAKLGEGVLNGVLTARIGLSAMQVCRPTPFMTEKPPGVGDVAPFLFGDKTKS